MKLTDNLLRKLPTPEQGNKITYDDAVKGFGVRVTAAGGRAFILNYRRKLDGRERRYTIGNHPDWSTTAAREEAKRLKRLVDGGNDPVGEQEEKRAAATVADLCARFERDYLSRNRLSSPAKRPCPDACKSDGRRPVANVQSGNPLGLAQR